MTVEYPNFIAQPKWTNLADDTIDWNLSPPGAKLIFTSFSWNIARKLFENRSISLHVDWWFRLGSNSAEN